MLAAVPGLPDKVAEYSSHVPADRRAAALAAFRSGSVKVLVTSDAMARGMDVANVANVINYDPPVYPKTYVHRAGRTARAGEAGAVYTLLKPEDVVHFNGMVGKLEGAGMKQMKLQPEQLQPLRPALKEALQQVQQLLQQEKQEQQRQVKQQEQRQQQRRQDGPSKKGKETRGSVGVKQGHAEGEVGEVAAAEAVADVPKAKRVKKQ